MPSDTRKSCAGLVLVIAGCGASSRAPEPDAATAWFEGHVVRREVSSRNTTIDCWIAYGRERCSQRGITTISDFVAGRVCSMSPSTPPSSFDLPRSGLQVAPPAAIRPVPTNRRRTVAGRPCMDWLFELPTGYRALVCIDDVLRQQPQMLRAAPEDRPWAEGLVLRFEPVGAPREEVMRHTMEVTSIELTRVPVDRFDCNAP